MTDIKFKFSNEKQRHLNIGQSIDPVEDNIRRKGRHIRHLKVNMSKAELRKLYWPDGIIYATYALKDVHGQPILPHSPAYLTHRPVIVTLMCSEHHPFPLSRYTIQDLDTFITNTFGGKIITENITSKEESGIDEHLFTHTGMLEQNADTDLDSINKHAFNVRPAFVYDHELDYLNKKLEILGYKVKKSDALMVTDKTLTKPRKLIYELGDF